MATVQRTPATTFAGFTVLLALAVAGQLHAQELAPAPTPATNTLKNLQSRLAELVAQPRFAAGMFGIKVMSLDSGKTVFEHDSRKLFSPASNAKLYTVALALDRLGPDYRIKTSLYSASRPSAAGVLKGDLIVYGRGDPTINARRHEGRIEAALEPLAHALIAARVKEIRGDLVGDESFIHGAPYGSGWVWDDMEYEYGAEISALTINDNTLELVVMPAERVGQPCKWKLEPASDYLSFSNRTQTVEKGGKRTLSLYRPLEQNVVYLTGQMPTGDTGYTNDVTFHNPPGVFLRFYKEALARHGIKFKGRLRTVNWLQRQARPMDYGKLVELGATESAPMRELAAEVMKPSQNLYTDLLLAQVGEKARGPETPAEQTSEEVGIRELYRFLAKAGVPREEVFFEEGSGLSRNNLTTPNATVRLLEFMSRQENGAVYLSALPVAGVDGTLRNRMKGTAAAGNVRAKTGALRWANSLSGHVTTAAGERLIFSVMLNRYHNQDPGHGARAELDAVAIMLASLAEKTE